MVIGCTTECFKVYSCLPKGPPDCIPQGGSKAFLILVTLPLMVREGGWLRHWTGWFWSMCLCQGTGIWSKCKFQVKKIQTLKWKHMKKEKKKTQKKHEKPEQKGRKEKQAFAAGGELWLRDQPQAQKETWARGTCCPGARHRLQEDWATPGAGHQTRGVIKITRKQR